MRSIRILIKTAANQYSKYVRKITKIETGVKRVLLTPVSYKETAIYKGEPLLGTHLRFHI